MTGDDLEREMFILRKLIEKEKAERISATPPEKDPKAQADAADFYICTLSNRIMVYKVKPISFQHSSAVLFQAALCTSVHCVLVGMDLQASF